MPLMLTFYSKNSEWLSLLNGDNENFTQANRVKWIPKVLLEKWDLPARRRRPEPSARGSNAPVDEPTIKLMVISLGEFVTASLLPGMNMTFFSPTDCGLGRCQPRMMQAHELFQYFRLPELLDFRQYVRTLPTNTLMGFGAFAALTTFWYATRPRALKPPCDLAMQSVEVPVSGTWPPPGFPPLSPVSRPHHGDIQQDHNPKQIFVFQGTLQTEMCSPDRTSAAMRGRGQNIGQRDARGGAG